MMLPLLRLRRRVTYFVLLEFALPCEVVGAPAIRYNLLQLLVLHLAGVNFRSLVKHPLNEPPVQKSMDDTSASVTASPSSLAKTESTRERSQADVGVLRIRANCAQHTLKGNSQITWRPPLGSSRLCALEETAQRIDDCLMHLNGPLVLGLRLQSVILVGVREELLHPEH
eukprot:6200637-Pleurochrysis_carterae.AAC.1